MNIKSILCPIDFSTFSDAALSYASVLAAESNAHLYIVFVEESLPEYPPDFSDYGMGSLPNEELQGHSLLYEVRPTIAGVDFEHHYLKGSPAAEILNFAEHHEIDLIVMGTHGRKGLLRLLMGSVAEKVVRQAKCPVLTVKQPADGDREAVGTSSEKHRAT